MGEEEIRQARRCQKGEAIDLFNVRGKSGREIAKEGDEGMTVNTMRQNLVEGITSRRKGDL